MIQKVALDERFQYRMTLPRAGPSLMLPARGKSREPRSVQRELLVATVYEDSGFVWETDSVPGLGFLQTEFEHELERTILRDVAALKVHHLPAFEILG